MTKQNGSNSDPKNRKPTTANPQGKSEAIAAANKLYADNRAEMDKGYVPNWEWAYHWAGKSELSPAQHYFNEIADKSEAVVGSELDNDASLRQSVNVRAMLSSDEIEAKRSSYASCIVPDGMHTVTIGCDVQAEALYFAVLAFGDAFTASVIDYGIWPKQPSRHLSYANIERTLSMEYPNAGNRGRIHAGILDLAEHLFTLGYRTESGVEIRPGLMLVDRGFETDTVDAAIHATPFNVAGCMGVGIKAATRPMASWKIDEGERHGYH